MSSPFSDLYTYSPSEPLAITGIVLFFLVFVGTITQIIRLRTWCFFPMIIAASLEHSGYISRLLSILYPWNLGTFWTSELSLILAPTFISTTLIILSTRLVHSSTSPSLLTYRTLWLTPTLVLPLFVVYDFFCFFVQLLGIVTIGIGYIEGVNRVANGSRLLRIGLVMQIVGYAVILAVAARFLIVSRNWVKEQSESEEGEWTKRNVKKPGQWWRLAWVVVGSLGLLMLRATYRIFEFTTTSASTPSYLQSHEWLFWAFDTLPVLIVSAVFIVFHPGYYLPREMTTLVFRTKNAEETSKEIYMRPTDSVSWIGQPLAPHHAEAVPHPYEPRIV
ncbi:uncharacterized protein BDZ99DRAFT_464050 [Mytilinidion resinicola]|uniref:RTA1-domain-containing protein n=1 Tax=Mytilinidion resinicola TaxID=574789 RepID=A0A6A6YJI8_9PEZI|nr:uncharacterized protein BDZ99DRAFT_464050 [Mytilinidion resinicola]KAF2808154.1 hypothetical protein BDZ99DRAFT_464050 [Mytilinidion resinicola]